MGVIGNGRRGFKTEGNRTIHSPQRGKTVARTCFLLESFFSSQEDIEEESVLVQTESLTEPFICAGVRGPAKWGRDLVRLNLALA